MGEEGFNHGMTPQFLKRIREFEKENLALKQIIAEKELENKLNQVFTHPYKPPENAHIESFHSILSYCKPLTDAFLVAMAYGKYKGNRQ